MNLAPHPFTLRQLQYVVAVADALSFRKAAEQCHVSQPSLSAQIAQLEGVLGVQLFERDRRRVLLTHVGTEVVQRARRLLVEVDALAEAALRAGDPLSGTLRLGVIPTVSPYLLPAVTPALRKHFPRLTVRWLEDKTEALTRELERGGLDAALVALEADLGDVESEVLADDPFFLVTPKDHPLGLKKGDALPSELRGQDVLLLDEGHCFREQALSLCSKARAHELEFRATSLPTLTQMIASGAGVTLLPALAVATEVKRSELRVRPFANPAPKRTLALIWRKRSPFSGALQQVAGAMRDAWPRK
ncbi:LysR substrate-binding domain-containing protein [Pyxidicoccus trucidator]|uniref:LysR substrate-binding domain-containing protein n=1 Tax=Pyxidicoccus trucidator TaxID=2709662 RepID=UPI0013DB6148|nr:LysR substrate-binding domain-containing protein [Pyxidicoccus trucidator]